MSTDREAKAQIARAIEANGTASAEEYDLATILDETHTFTPDRGYAQTVTAEEFWQIVAASEKAPA